MIVRLIALKHWRSLLSEVEIRLTEGLNVVTGPNESGKTSIAEALYHGLLTPYTTGNQTSRLWIPVGRGLSPSVTLEFECRGQRYRVKKSFGPEARASLYRWEGDSYKPLATGRRVQEQLEQLLRQDGVLEYARGLWYIQGTSGSWTLGGLDDADRDRLRNALRGMLFHPEDEAVERYVEEEFKRRLQPRRLAPATRGPLGEALSRWQDARRKREQYEQKQVDYDAEARKLADLLADRKRLADEEQQHQARLAQLRKGRESWTEYELLQNQARSVSSRAQELRRIHEGWEDAVRHLQETLEQLAYKRAELAAQTEAARQVEVELTDASAHADRLRQKLDALAAAEEYVRALLATREAKRCQELRVQAAYAPERPEMDALRDLKRKTDVLRARAEQAAVRVRLQPVARLTGSIARDGEPDQPFQATPDGQVQWDFVRSFRLELEGMGVLHAEAGSEDAWQAQQQSMEKKRELASRMARWVAVEEGSDVGDLEAAWETLEGLYRRAEDLRQRAEVLEREMRERFGYGPDEAEARLEGTRERLPTDRSLLEEALGTPWSEPGSLPGEKLEELAGRLRACLDDLRKHCREAEAQRDRLRQDFNAIQWELGRLEGSVEELTRTTQNDRDRLWKARAQAARELGHPDPDPVPEDGWSADMERNLPLFHALADAVKKEEARAAKLEGGLRAARPQGEPVGDDEVRWEEAELDRVRDEIRRCEADIHRLEGRLRERGDGLWEELQQARAEEEAARAALERECLDARALHLLRQELAGERQRRLEGVLEGVRESVVVGLKQLTSGRYREARLDAATLRPVGLQPDGTEEWLSCDDQLSQGTSEQVAFLVRLGLARFLASTSGQRQLVVFDDPLVNTDPERQQKAWKLLLEAAQDLQVLYLTCHDVPDWIKRYAHVLPL